MSTDEPGPERDVYTHGHHPSVLRSHTARTVENSARYLIPHLRPGISILDIGCGPGTITVELAQRVFPGSVIGIDLSSEVLAKARTAVDPSVEANVEFRVGDCYRLEADDGSLDIVHAHQLLQHLTNPVAALAEMRRVVGDNGVVAVRDADYHGMFWAPYSPLLTRWMEIYQAVARHNGAEPDAGRHLAGWARQAGFRSIRPSASTWCFATEQDRRWWGELWSQRVLHSALAAQAVDYGVADHDELEAVSQGWLNWARDPESWFAVVHGELILGR